MLSDDEETADSCVKKEFREAINFHQQAHDILEDYSKTSQDAHESMLREGDILEELKQLANSAHESFKKSRSLSTKYHNEYIFLSKRLGRELNKRLRYLEMDNYLDKMKSDEIESQVKASITKFYSKELGSFDNAPQLHPEDIRVVPKKKECYIEIITDDAGLFIGKGKSRLARLEEKLISIISVPFRITINSPGILKSDLDVFFKESLQKFILEHSGDYELNISKVEYKPLVTHIGGIPKSMNIEKLSCVL